MIERKRKTEQTLWWIVSWQSWADTHASGYFHYRSPQFAPMLHEQMFDEIYSTDLRYLPECWKLCGDAHCCSFSRYKSRFKIMGRTPFQELPLLPGEHEYLSRKGLLRQFGDHEHRSFDVGLDTGTIRVETIVSRRPHCACDQDTRTTVCRLYPLLPLYELDGTLIGAEPLGIYEVLEDLQALSPACRLTDLPFGELNKFLRLTSAIARSPLALFYVMAYRIAKEHVRERLRDAHSRSTGDIFQLFEGMLLRRKLTDQGKLKAELNSLAARFRDHYGTSFSLAPSADAMADA